MRNIQPKNQSTWPAKVLSMQLKVWPNDPFTPSWLILYFFIFQLCKIVWRNYVSHFSIWALSWENPRATCKLHVQTIKVQINCVVWSTHLLFATWKVWLLRLLYAKTRGFWDWAGQFLSNLINRNTRRQVFKWRSSNSKTGGFQEYILFSKHDIYIINICHLQVKMIKVQRQTLIGCL